MLVAEETEAARCLPGRGRLARGSWLWMVNRRVDRGKSQEDIGSAVGLPQSSISDWEGGRRRPRAAYRAALAEALDIDRATLDEEIELFFG